jgi:hypothetical protein
MSRYRFATFWAAALVVLGMLLVVGGVLFAAAAVALDMPWGRLTGLAGAPFIVLGEMLRLFIEQRQIIGRQRRLLARIARRLDEAADQRPPGSTPADRLLQQRPP